MKFSTWLEARTARTVPISKNKKIDLTGALGPECEKCGEKMVWVPERTYKIVRWNTKPGNVQDPANKGHWMCRKCRIRKAPTLKKGAHGKIRSKIRSILDRDNNKNTK